jgi:RNA polymerase sigma factor (sigma-70 family)
MSSRPVAGLERDDIRQEGALALVRAAAAFDPARGEFEPFAPECVRNAIKSAIRRAVGAAAKTVSAEAHVDVIESIPDEAEEDRREAPMANGLGAALARALSGLTEQERMVVASRFGLGRERVGLSELGRELGVSQARVHQIERAALQKLQRGAVAREFLVFLRRCCLTHQLETRRPWAL